ncbi:EH signature domain-containing protein [Paraburkholderia acidicola]|uniref:EH signature domain-containing protein n=1 Tax=Paraburkholderia acidicola TaxID=1912599 RepID=A0ABV1LGQ4_9BURK
MCVGDKADDQAREMVFFWLKERLVADFFELLSVDGINDKRRVAYWLRFVSFVEDMWFALGSSAVDVRAELTHWGPDSVQTNSEVIISAGTRRPNLSDYSDRSAGISIGLRDSGRTGIPSRLSTSFLFTLAARVITCMFFVLSIPGLLMHAA